MGGRDNPRRVARARTNQDHLQLCLGGEGRARRRAIPDSRFRLDADDTRCFQGHHCRCPQSQLWASQREFGT